MLHRKIIIHADVIVNTDSPSIAQARYEESILINQYLNLKDDGVQLENVEIEFDDKEKEWELVKKQPKTT